MHSPDQTSVAATARAFATYALVPYLGIIFCPGAVLVGSLGLFRSYQIGETGRNSSRVTCFLSIVTGLIVLAVQIGLWWILYKVPLWAKGL